MNKIGCVLPVVGIFVLTGCIANDPLEKDIIATVGDAENILFTDSGRLFVSGASGVTEITADGSGGYSAQAFFSPDTECSFTGLAQINQWLFTACMGLTGKSLFAIDLNDSSHFVVLDTLDDMAIPNGIAALPGSDELLIADENFFGQGGVAKAAIDFSGDLPVLVSLELEWLGAAQGVRVSNGIKVRDDHIYLSDYGKLQRIYLDPVDGPQAAVTLYETATVLDDLTLYCDGALITDFIYRTVTYVNNDAEIVAVSPAAFDSPSSVSVAMPPLFSTGDILITEKGYLLDPEGEVGNTLVRVTAEQLGLPGC